MANAAQPHWSHVGLCVSDLERSLRFYCDGVGCQRAERFELDGRQVPGLAEALEVASPAVMVSQMVTTGPLKIELLGWSSPKPEGSPSTRRNQLGLTHLSFHVDDVDRVAAKLVACGGTLLQDTRRSPGVELVFVADPDGTRVELMARKP
jgi:lactoylglutathione lyase